jgi:hypothetical protein
MSRPLFLKELRETWWMGLIALVVAGGIAIDEMGLRFDHDGRIQWALERGRSPFLDVDLAVGFGATALCLGAALGFWQTLSESVTGTWSYLLHRPISRKAIIGTKLLAGLSILLISLGLPFLIYFLWALSGAHAAPFEFWMMEGTLQMLAAGLVGYLAAFLAGLRDARFYVSRLWPVLPALLIFLAQAEYEWLPTAGWVLILLAAGLYLPSIFFAAENRDYA